MNRTVCTFITFSQSHFISCTKYVRNFFYFSYYPIINVRMILASSLGNSWDSFVRVRRGPGEREKKEEATPSFLVGDPVHSPSPLLQRKPSVQELPEKEARMIQYLILEAIPEKVLVCQLLSRY